MDLVQRWDWLSQIISHPRTALFQKSGAQEKNPTSSAPAATCTIPATGWWLGKPKAAVFSFPAWFWMVSKLRNHFLLPGLILTPERMFCNPEGYLEGHFSPITTAGALGQACKGNVSKCGVISLLPRDGKVAAERQPWPGPRFRNSSLGSWDCGAKWQNPHPAPSGNWTGGKDQLEWGNASDACFPGRPWTKESAW